jgi:hypothetical protein
MGIGDTLSSLFTSVTGKSPQQVADEAKRALKIPDGIGTDAGISRTLEAPLPYGETLTGGRRRKTRRTKKSRKTNKRK